jgi:hypothetical protein
VTRTLSESLSDLRRPFTVQAVKFKPQTVMQDKTKALASFYIDARLAAERLNTVVGAENWSDSYRLLADGAATPALYYPVECSLRVCGVTKVDVGQGADTKLDEKAWKSAYSDALKRAAVKFGIGVYLYVLPNVWAPVRVDAGKVKGFSEEGVKQLRSAYVRWLDSSANTFGAALDHGDVEDLPGSEGAVTADTEASSPATADTEASSPAGDSASSPSEEFASEEDVETVRQEALDRELPLDEFERKVDAFQGRVPRDWLEAARQRIWAKPLPGQSEFAIPEGVTT